MVAQAAPAAITTTCVFNESTQSLDYSVTGGGAGLAYTLSVVTESGNVQMPAAPDLTGPNDAASVVLTCLGPLGTGQLTVDICQGAVCFTSYDFNFVSDANCDLFEAPSVSTSSNWSLAGLLVLLLAAGIVMIRRRQTVTNQ
jgi:MYXO-CTERM domain-containing protein